MKKKILKTSIRDAYLSLPEWKGNPSSVRFAAADLVFQLCGPVSLTEMAKMCLGVAAYVVGKKFSEQLRVGICAMSKTNSCRMR